MSEVIIVVAAYLYLFVHVFSLIAIGVLFKVFAFVYNVLFYLFLWAQQEFVNLALSLMLD